MSKYDAVFWALSTNVLMIFTYWCGRYQERMNWNELIKSGALPKPRGAK